MEQRRNGRFYTKRSAHYNNLQKQEEEEKLKSSSSNNNNNSNNSNNNTSTLNPLKDNSNIKPRKSLEIVNQSQTTSPPSNSLVKTNTIPKLPSDIQIKINTPVTSKIVNRKIVPSLNNQNLIPKLSSGGISNERPLKCLETLAQKAGITISETTTQPKMDKSQVSNPAQQMPVHISAEQFQQLQQFQLQQAFAAGGAIQVKQEFPQNQTNTLEQLNKQIQEQNQAAQVQQMQLIDTSVATSQHQAQNNAMGIKYVNGEQQQQQTSTTMTTLPPLQLQNGQLPADWNQRLQVVQQPIQNPQYLQTIYGQQVLMPSNLVQQGLNQQPIQFITGKTLQGGQITPQMLATAQGKQVIGNSTGGFSGTYATLPTSQSQALLFSQVPVNVFNSQPQQQQQQQQQQNILPITATTTQNNGNISAKNQQEMKNYTTTQKVVQKANTVNANGQNQMGAPTNAQQNQQCVQVSQSAIPTAQIINQIQQPGGQQMQFAAPWLQSAPLQQFYGLPQFQNSIIFRQDGSAQGMLIPQAQAIQAQAPQAQQNQLQQVQAQTQQAQIQQTNQPQQQATQIQQATQPQQTTQAQQQQTQQTNVQQTITQQNTIQSTPNKQRMVTETHTPKQQTPTRTPTLLPQSANQSIRPNQASSVSTQTSANQNQMIVNQKNAKALRKPQNGRPVVPNLKTDAGNQTKLLQGGQTLQQIVTSAGNKMVVTMNNNGTQMIQQMIPKQQQTTYLQQQPNQQIQMIPQQMQLQQIQLTGQGQTQYVNQSDQQQIQNQILQSQQMAMQQQAQGALNTSQANGIQSITIQQPKQILVSQQSVAQSQANMENRPIMTMVSIGNNGTSPLNAMQNLTSPIGSPSNLTLQPPPNPLAAMTSLSYSTTPTGIVTNSTATIAKEDKIPSKIDESQKSIAESNTVSTSATVTTVTNGAMTISSATLTPTVSAAPKDKTTDSLKTTISIGKSSPKRADNVKADNAKSEETAKTQSEPTKANSNVNISTGKTSPKKISSPKPVSPKPTVEKPTANSTSKDHAQSANEENIAVNGNSVNDSQPPIPPLNLIKSDKGLVPKAMVKPNVLTHFIGGHVIQEGNEPFPVTRQRYSEDDGPPSKRRNISPEKPATGDRSSCSQCGKKDSKGKLKYKPYCSKACTKAAKARAIPTIQQNGEHKLRIRNENGTTNGSVSPKSLPSPSSSSASTNGTTSDSSSNGSSDTSSINKKKSSDPTPMEVSTDADTDQDEPISFLVKWSVDEVCDYIRSLAGYSDYAEDFANHEIDGQALVLLNENHLVNTMNIKLGPALKIMSQIEAIKKKGAPQTEQQPQ